MHFFVSSISISNVGSTFAKDGTGFNAQDVYECVHARDLCLKSQSKKTQSSFSTSTDSELSINTKFIDVLPASKYSELFINKLQYCKFG